jgi:hypothetical protein
VKKLVSEGERSVAGYSPDSNDVRTEAEERPLLETVARERLLKTASWKRLSGCFGDL